MLQGNRWSQGRWAVKTNGRVRKLVTGRRSWNGHVNKFDTPLQVRYLAVWTLVLANLVAVGARVGAGGHAVSYSVSAGAPDVAKPRVRHAGCNFRFVRELMRRACAYHSSESSQLGRDLETNELPIVAGFAGGQRHHKTSFSIGGEYHEAGRHKIAEELIYIRRILKECCPNQKCPPLSKFCRY